MVSLRFLLKKQTTLQNISRTRKKTTTTEEELACLVFLRWMEDMIDGIGGNGARGGRGRGRNTLRGVSFFLLSFYIPAKKKNQFTKKKITFKPLKKRISLQRGKKKIYYLCKEENERKEKDKKDIKKNLSENLSSANNVEEKLDLSFPPKPFILLPFFRSQFFFSCYTSYELLYIMMRVDRHMLT